MSKTTNKFSPEVGSRAVRLFLEHEHPSRYSTTLSNAPKITAPGRRSTLSPSRRRSSELQARRRSAPVKTSIRRASLVSALCSVTILSLNGEMDTADSQNCPSNGRWAHNSAYVLKANLVS
jgi:hypothetical protein